jgi:hypothetical protein
MKHNKAKAHKRGKADWTPSLGPRGSERVGFIPEIECR